MVSTKITKKFVRVTNFSCEGHFPGTKKRHQIVPRKNDNNKYNPVITNFLKDNITNNQVFG